jgi:hypothetical protein
VFSLCDPEACDIQQAVVEATGGIVWDIYQCPYDELFARIGFSTSTLSTAICGIETDDPASLVVTYLGGATAQEVPNVSTDGMNGWSYDPSLGCIDFHGSWAAVEGSFRIDFGMGSAPDPRVCFGPGIEPIVSSIVLRYASADGEVVPQSAADGWTFDVASDCFDFHGSWAAPPLVHGPFFVEYLDVNR